ncbi:MAG: hypothetical protein LRY76_07545 [Alphaproteobacteria bacterium]|nr:hypothetical protein [Alphaproteobacteria bacterium]
MREIPHKHGLVFEDDFRLVASRLKRQLPALFELCVAGAHIPPANLAVWNRHKPRHNNCYNFVRNIRNDRYLQPGDLIARQKQNIANDDSPPANFQSVSAHPLLQSDFKVAAPHVYEFAHKVIASVNQDSAAVWAGYDLRGYLETPLAHGWPVALFFKSWGVDYHWYALRRRTAAGQDGQLYAFAHKLGNRRATWVPANDIFKDAKKTGYNYFAGFFHFDNE